MTEQVRVGVVGTSWWADLMYLPSLQHHPQAQLAAICGRNAERAAEMATKYAIPHVFTDYQTMIAQGDLDALIIATPDDLHHPIAIAAIDAGLHVLCEKPLALSTAHARAMYERAEEAGVVHMALFTYRFLPHIRYLCQLLADGYIGRCYDAQFRLYGNYGRGEAYSWRFDRRRAVGILGDLGSHIIDLARLTVGEIARVNAQLGTFVERPGADDHPPDPANDSALLTVAFANGAQGVIHTSALVELAERGMEQQIVLHGDAGTLEVDLHLEGPSSGATIRGARRGDPSFRTLPIPTELWGGVDSTTPFMTHCFELFATQSVGPRLFVDSILANQPVSPSFYDGMRAQQVIDAAIESHQSGRWVALAQE